MNALSGLASSDRSELLGKQPINEVDHWLKIRLTVERECLIRDPQCRVVVLGLLHY